MKNYSQNLQILKAWLPVSSDCARTLCYEMRISASKISRLVHGAGTIWEVEGHLIESRLELEIDVD